VVGPWVLMGIVEVDGLGFVFVGLLEFEVLGFVGLLWFEISGLGVGWRGCLRLGLSFVL